MAHALPPAVSRQHKSWGRADLTIKEDAAALSQFRRGKDTLTIGRWYGINEASVVRMLDRARSVERSQAREWAEAAPR